VFLIMIGASIPWRSKVYYEGGLDTVVLIKAAMIIVALGLAILVVFGRPARQLRPGPLVFVLCYLSCTMIGALSTGYLVAGGVIATRVLLVAIIILVLSRTFSADALLGSLVIAQATFAAVATATGHIEEGRLAGGIPPLHSNELASACAIIVLYCLWKVSAGQDSWLHLAAIGGAFAVLVATGSRTPLFAMAAASLVLVFFTHAVRVRTLVIGLTLAPVALWLVTATDLLQSILVRDDNATQLTTLNSRTVAWQAALAPKSSLWQTWFGGGLEMKQIEVKGQYWNQQILDSSWISALVQGGILGLAICALWMFSTMVSTGQSARRVRALQLALLIYLSIRGFFESGLFDASTAFIAFFVVAAGIPLRAPRERGLVGMPQDAEQTGRRLRAARRPAPAS
jgi:O-Antigen ligase